MMPLRRTGGSQCSSSWPGPLKDQFRLCGADGPAHDTTHNYSNCCFAAWHDAFTSLLCQVAKVAHRADLRPSFEKQCRGSLYGPSKPLALTAISYSVNGYRLASTIWLPLLQYANPKTRKHLLCHITSCMITISLQGCEYTHVVMNCALPLLVPSSRTGKYLMVYRPPSLVAGDPQSTSIAVSLYDMAFTLAGGGAAVGYVTPATLPRLGSPVKSKQKAWVTIMKSCLWHTGSCFFVHLLFHLASWGI